MITLRKKVKIAKVCFTARANANIEDCIRECIAFSAKNNVDTALEHNGQVVEISVSGLVTKIYRDWDRKINIGIGIVK